MEVINGDVVRSLWGNRFVEWVILEAEGTAGLLLMWDTWAIEILDCVKG